MKRTQTTDYTEMAVTSRVKDQFQQALSNPSPARRITILTDIAKSVSQDVIEVDLPISASRMRFRLLSEKQADDMGTTPMAFYRLMRDAAINIASEACSIAASEKSEGQAGLAAVAKAEEHMRLAGVCETLMQGSNQTENRNGFTMQLHKTMEQLASSTGISQDYLKNQHLYHILMA